MIKVKQNGSRVWVTFTYSPEAAAESVMLCGEWNGWEEEPMKRKKSGEFYATKVLKAGNAFQFGYKVDGVKWEIEDECPAVTSPFASQNSLLEL